MAIPAAKILERIGDRASVMFGLLGMALSAAAFVPAAILQSYAVFLAALFALASSITLFASGRQSICGGDRAE
jgi:MFS transporter, FHS family, L-fucose permease